MNHDPTPRWTDYLAMPLMYYAAAKLSLYFSMGSEGIVLFTAQSAVLLAALTIFNGRSYYQWLMLALLAECLASWPTHSLSAALTLGLTNIFLAILAFTILGRMKFDLRFGKVADLSKFVIGAIIAAGLIEAIADTVLRAEVIGLKISYLESIRSTWFANALGLVIFAPLVFAFWRAPQNELPIKAKRIQTDYLAAVVAAILAVVLLKADDSRIFNMHVGPILLLPLVLYTAARRDLRYTVTCLLGLALLTVYLTITWSNPFGVISQGDMIIAAQQFLVISAITALGISALISQIRYQQFNLEQANKELSNCNSCLELQLEKGTSKLESISHELERLTLTDQTTELPNWRGFLDLALHELSRSQRHKEPVCLLSLDIDNFKAVNDQYGHQGGDEVLKQLGHVLSDVIRGCDIAARFGGEEFIVLAPNTNLDQGQIFAERIRKAVEEAALKYHDKHIKVTTSVGVALHRTGENLDKLSHRAEQCLHQAKRNGRNCIVDERDKLDEVDDDQGWQKQSAENALNRYGQPI